MYVCVYTFSDLFTPKVNVRCNKTGKEKKKEERTSTSQGSSQNQLKPKPS